MSFRGSRFLPESETYFAAIDYTCSVCWPITETVLNRDSITTTHERFEDEHRSSKGTDAVEEQYIRPDDGQGGGRFRYKMVCPRCGHERVLRVEKMTAALRAVYERGARAKIVRALI